MPITYSRLSVSATVDFRQSFRGFRELPTNAYAGTQDRGSRPISRVLSWTIIPLGHSSPNASSSLPGSLARTPRCRFPCDFPIWPCTRRGLPCHRCYHLRGAPLPHHFTLTCDPSHEGSSRVGGFFLLHFPWARAPQVLPGAVSEGARTFLYISLRNAAIAWPTPRDTIRPDDLNHKCAATR